MYCLQTKGTEQQVCRNAKPTHSERLNWLPFPPSHHQDGLKCHKNLAQTDIYSWCANVEGHIFLLSPSCSSVSKSHLNYKLAEIAMYLNIIKSWISRENILGEL